MADPGDSKPSGKPISDPSDAGQSDRLWAHGLAIGVTFAVLLLVLEYVGEFRMRELPWWRQWGLRLILAVIAFALGEGLVRVLSRLFRRGPPA